MAGPTVPSPLHRPVLVLNASYEPVHVCAVRRALVLVVKGVATTEEAGDGRIHSPSLSLAVPSVIRLLEYRRIPRQVRAISRKNILIRDQYTCQYCNRRFGAADLTLDHVVPRSRGGTNTWENLVASCLRCNNRKGDRLPSEASMQLRTPPKPFTLHTSRTLMRQIGNHQEKWRKYLFY
ncbi:MAG: HNH endonuclease [Bryobacterales bacterium]|nr:HNH endonuclease [Bryobacterales bacterium]